MASQGGITTRSRNASQHPGLVAQRKPRRTTEQVASERQAKEQVKIDKELTKVAHIKRIAEYEKGQADLDANDMTPRAAPRTRPLVRTRSYADVLSDREAVLANDVEMDSDDNNSTFVPVEVEDEGTTTEECPEPPTSPPRKRAKVGPKTKAPKPKVRDAIKAVQVTAATNTEGSSRGEATTSIVNTNKGNAHVDPTYFTRRFAAPAAESDVPPWRVPELSDDEGIAVALAPKGGAGGGKVVVKGKGKGNEKVPVVPNDTNNHHDVAKRVDKNRRLPNSKRQVNSHILAITNMLTLDETTLYYFFLSDNASKSKKDFSSGINSWAASVPSNSRPASKATTNVSQRSIFKNSTSSRSGSMLPPLTHGSTRSSAHSVLTTDVKISHDIKAEPQNDIEIAELGLSDEDETKGLERDAAIMSPPKGKKRINSSVGNILFYPPFQTR